MDLRPLQGRAERDMAMKPEDFEQSWIRYIERIIHQDIEGLDFEAWIDEFKRMDALPPDPDASALVLFRAFLREAESATDIEAVREKARILRKTLAGIERAELEAKADLVENPVLERVVETLIRKAFEQGKTEGW